MLHRSRKLHAAGHRTWAALLMPLASLLGAYFFWILLETARHRFAAILHLSDHISGTSLVHFTMARDEDIIDSCVWCSFAVSETSRSKNCQYMCETAASIPAYSVDSVDMFFMKNYVT
eukprot:6207009-Pleurochrysis_carterae.AAC.2